MELKLILAKGEPRGKEIVIARQPTVIGRDPGCDLVLASPKVSRQHCRIDTEGDAIILLDDGSRNGTFVNGQKVTDRTVLSAGDQIVIGPLGFIVEIDGNRIDATQGGINDFLATLETGDDDVLQLTDDDLT
jgi:pSer/pThr/pTyr-binding forkhead associated (FHA) protein